MRHPVSFDHYRFEPASARLWSDGQEIRLTRKAAAVLGVLVDRAGQPVSKQELFATVWSNTVVSDDALTTCIQEIRKALGDDARQPRYIETRHRLGYLFVAALSANGQAGQELAAHDRAGRDRRDQGEPGQAGGYPAGAGADPGAVAAPAATPRAPAIAVLPFRDMSPARDQDYFCEGLAEELIDALTHVDGLRVAARSASFQFRDPGLDIRDVGQRLGVDSLLEGSVRKAGDRLRITVQLIDVASGYHKWSQRFERELGDVFAIQDEIAETVATLLRGETLSQNERRAVRRQQTASAPYECFLRGRQCLHRMRRPDLEMSQHMFERAIALDKDYAPAWAGLATVHALLYEWWGAREEDLQRTDRASQIAMDLAPELADAHVARGFALSLHRRYDEAQVHFEAAARINPNLFDAFYYYARACFARGEIERSAELFRRAMEIRQEDFQSATLLAQSLRIMGREEEAAKATREGIARAERILALNPQDGRALSIGAVAFFNQGDVQRAMEWSARSLELYPDDMSALINAACIHAKAGMKEEALALLERAFGRGWGKRDWVEHDPDYDSLRDDPRFKAMLAKLR